MTTIRIFVTGGTFDKEYDEIRGRESGESAWNWSA
jgi:hypothetical protein